MKYLMVRWKHAEPDEPRVLYSELDDQRMQRRKIDVFPDGRWGFADEHEEAGGSGLGDVPTPSVEQLNAYPEYQATEIDNEEFEKMWDMRRNARIVTPFPLDEGPDEMVLS